MEEQFEIPVRYQDKELQFNTQLLQVGYVHKILVDVKGQPVSIDKMMKEITERY